MAEEKKRSGAKKRAAEEKDDFYDREEEVKPRSPKKRASASSSGGAHKRAETPHLKESAESRSELKKKESNPSSFGNQLMAILLSVIALFIIICFIFKDSVGLLGTVISDGFCGLFGFAAFFIPLFLIQLAIYWKKDVSTGAVRYKYIVAILRFSRYRSSCTRSGLLPQAFRNSIALRVRSPGRVILADFGKTARSTAAAALSAGSLPQALSGLRAIPAR